MSTTVRRSLAGVNARRMVQASMRGSSRSVAFLGSNGVGTPTNAAPLPYCHSRGRPHRPPPTQKKPRIGSGSADGAETERRHRHARLHDIGSGQAAHRGCTVYASRPRAIAFPTHPLLPTVGLLGAEIAAGLKKLHSPNVDFSDAKR